MEHHNRSFLDRLLADNFIDSTYRGTTRTKSDVLNGHRNASKYKSIGFESTKVRFYAKTAIVTGVNVVQNVEDASKVVRVRYTDVFVRQTGRWRVVSAQETLETGH